jgi:hypothetical protein
VAILSQLFTDAVCARNAKSYDVYHFVATAYSIAASLSENDSATEPSLLLESFPHETGPRVSKRRLAASARRKESISTALWSWLAVMISLPDGQRDVARSAGTGIADHKAVVAG